MNTGTILEVQDIYKNFQVGNKRVDVLNGVNFSLNRGEIVSILGVSGAGKSTLLSIIGTLDRPNKGMITLDGENVTKMDEMQLAIIRNKKIGFVFQFHYLLPEFTALENVAMPGFIQDKSRHDVVNRARELLVNVGLGERLDHKPSELSGGELQRTAVARALINDPAIVLADEPTGNLDRENGKAVYDLILDLSNKSNKTFLVVTHNESISERTNRILTLSDGKIII